MVSFGLGCGALLWLCLLFLAYGVASGARFALQALCDVAMLFIVQARTMAVILMLCGLIQYLWMRPSGIFGCQEGYFIQTRLLIREPFRCAVPSGIVMFF